MFKKIFLIISFILVVTGFIRIFKSFAFENDIFEGKISFKAEAVKETELEKLRGGYMGVYFQVIFTGYWDTLGQNYVSIKGNNNDFININNQNTSDFSIDTISSSSQVKVKSIAVIGGFNGGNGIFQINQVPGSNNIVNNNLIINIAIFTTQEASTEALRGIFNILPF